MSVGCPFCPLSQEVTDLHRWKSVIEEFINEYNAVNTIGMQLVMFLDACEHVSRICRILRQPSGHALLLGVRGSGRQSLSRLASFIMDCDACQIEIVKGEEEPSFASAGTRKKEQFAPTAHCHCPRGYPLRSIQLFLSSSYLPVCLVRMHICRYEFVCTSRCVESQVSYSLREESPFCFL